MKHQFSTKCLESQKKEAQRVLQERIRKSEANAAFFEAFNIDVNSLATPITVESYFQQWIQQREDKRTVKDQATHIRKHVLPVLGGHALSDLKIRNVRQWMQKLKKKDLSPKTVRNIYGTFSKMCVHAVQDELLNANPCKLNERDLPDRIDSPKFNRHKAVFSVDEVVQIITSPLIPLRRRVFYAAAFLTGQRVGEVAGLNWGDYFPDEKPLGRLSVNKQFHTKYRDITFTKTGATREVPVHTVLARFLEEWRNVEWPKTFGRKPTKQDILIPNVTETESETKPIYWRTDSLRKYFKKDLARLGLRTRRVHDCRRTFISLAGDGNASQDSIRWVTHARSKDIVAQYTTCSWSRLCSVVEAIKLPMPDTPDPTPEPTPEPQGSGGQSGAKCLESRESNLHCKLDSTQVTDITEEKRWSRRESNPRPQIHPQEALRA